MPSSALLLPCSSSYFQQIQTPVSTQYSALKIISISPLWCGSWRSRPNLVLHSFLVLLTNKLRPQKFETQTDRQWINTRKHTTNGGLQIHCFLQQISRSLTPTSKLMYLGDWFYFWIISGNLCFGRGSKYLTDSLTVEVSGCWQFWNLWVPQENQECSNETDFRRRVTGLFESSLAALEILEVIYEGFSKLPDTIQTPGVFTSMCYCSCLQTLPRSAESKASFEFAHTFCVLAREPTLPKF